MAPRGKRQARVLETKAAIAIQWQREVLHVQASPVCLTWEPREADGSARFATTLRFFYPRLERFKTPEKPTKVVLKVSLVLSLSLTILCLDLREGVEDEYIFSQVNVYSCF